MVGVFARDAMRSTSSSSNVITMLSSSASGRARRVYRERELFLFTSSARVHAGRLIYLTQDRQLEARRPTAAPLEAGEQPAVLAFWPPSRQVPVPGAYWLPDAHVEAPPAARCAGRDHL